MSQPPPRKRAEILQCPHCDNDVGVTLDFVATQIVCPHCEQPMIVPSVDGSTELPPEEQPFVIVDDQPDEDEQAREAQHVRDSEGRLNSLRIQAIAAERRDLNRRRSFTTAAAIAMGIVVIHCLLQVAEDLAGEGWTRGTTAVTAVSIACGYAAILLLRRRRRLAELTRHPLLNDPESEPDFTPLNDGSQQWRHLEELQ